MSEDKRSKELTAYLKALHSPVRIPEIVNFYDLQVKFWDFALKDKFCHINFPYPVGFMFLVINYVYSALLRELIVSVRLYYTYYIFGLCLFKHFSYA